MEPHLEVGIFLRDDAASTFNKQLLDEVEHDIMNYVITRFSGRFSCYPCYNNQRETRLQRRSLSDS